MKGQGAVTPEMRGQEGSDRHCAREGLGSALGDSGSPSSLWDRSREQACSLEEEVETHSQQTTVLDPRQPWVKDSGGLHGQARKSLEEAGQEKGSGEDACREEGAGRVP